MWHFQETFEVQVPFVLFAKMKSREINVAITHYHLYMWNLQNANLSPH